MTSFFQKKFIKYLNFYFVPLKKCLNFNNNKSAIAFSSIAQRTNRPVGKINVFIINNYKSNNNNKLLSRRRFWSSDKSSGPTIYENQRTIKGT